MPSLHYTVTLDKVMNRVQSGTVTFKCRSVLRKRLIILD